MRIAVGSDHRGGRVRATVLDLLRNLGQDVLDLSADTEANATDDYPDIAAAVASRVSRGEVDRGILICGTGIGMCIVANKFPGVRAAPCHDDWSAEVSRRHNDLNVLCLAESAVSGQSLDRLLHVWLTTAFEGGRHSRRVEKIKNLDRGNGLS